MNTKVPFTFRAFGHLFELSITSNRICELQAQADNAIENGMLQYARCTVKRSISIKGYESADDSIALARIKRREDLAEKCEFWKK